MIIMSKVNRNNTYTLNNSKCFNLLNKFRNYILYNYDYSYYEEYKKFKDYYMNYYYAFYILYKITYYNYSGEYNREDGPAWIYYKNSEMHMKRYYLNNKKYYYEDYILEIKK